MGRYSIADSAATDLSQLWDGYIERGGSEANANRLVDNLFENFQNLADFPDLGTRRAYLPGGQLAFPHRDHMIFYRKSANGVDILHVLYGGIDFASYFFEAEH